VKGLTPSRRGGRRGRPVRPGPRPSHAYSGHNAYGDWGPPPNGSAPIVAVGLPPANLARLRDCRVVARIDNGLGIDNDEQGTRVDVCRGPVRSWSQEWPALRHLG
jgi:hypothetical protein